MGSYLGNVIATQMILNNLSYGQHYGQYVNDGVGQYQQVLNSTGLVVGYQEVPNGEDNFMAWYWWVLIVGVVAAIVFVAIINE